MKSTVKSHVARSFVVVLGTVLVVAGAGLAAARTIGGPPWMQPVLSPSATCDAAPSGCSSDADAQKKAEDAQALFAAFANDCGSAILGDGALTDAGTDPKTVDAYESLADALDGGQMSHGVQGLRSLLETCEAHANDGLRNALYQHGLNWLRHYEHELWLEQKFADKWPHGKPGRDATDSSHGKPDKPEHGHGNPHDADPSWAPGGGSDGDHGKAGGSHGNGNALGRS